LDNWEGKNSNYRAHFLISNLHIHFYQWTAPQPLGFSPNTINKLHKLYTYLQQLSKSLPSNQTIQDVHKEIVSAYASVMSKYVLASLKSLSDGSVEAIRNGDRFGQFSSFISCLLDMLNVVSFSLVEDFFFWLEYVS
jgi:hypothetical protein